MLLVRLRFSASDSVHNTIGGEVLPRRSGTWKYVSYAGVFMTPILYNRLSAGDDLGFH